MSAGEAAKEEWMDGCVKKAFEVTPFPQYPKLNKHFNNDSQIISALEEINRPNIFESRNYGCLQFSNLFPSKNKLDKEIQKSTDCG